MSRKQRELKYPIEGIDHLSAEEQSKIRVRNAGKRYRTNHRKKVLVNKKEANRRWVLKTKFNLTLEQYQDLLTKQNGCCAICQKSPFGEDTYRSAKSLSVDHDHDSGEVRGLLCDLCNRGIGQLQDSVVLLKKAVSYLESPTFIRVQKD